MEHEVIARLRSALTPDRRPILDADPPAHGVIARRMTLMRGAAERELGEPGPDLGRDHRGMLGDIISDR
jgi:hypothetical protein